jgi:predicted AlkP superfamily phosphohydrolase/phosphomutase/Tfp pilus assembly protein PilF
MFRSRFFRFLAILLGMSAALYLMISLFLPSSRRLIFGVDKNSGKVRLVRNTITYLPPHQFYRLSFEKRQGDAQRDGFVRIMSKERVPITISYRLRFSIPGERLPDARRMVRDGWSAWIRARVAEAVSAVTQQVPIEELLSPTSVFSARRDVLRQVVAGHLARSGLQVSAFEISRIEPDRKALLEFKRQELRREARGVAGRVAIFAIDGADWDLINELSIDGRIPNIRALIQGGTTASLQTIQPTVSPLVWATAATGLPPDRHGVIDFVDRTSKRPVDSSTRRSPAIWDIAEAFGRQTVAVNWWTAFPARSGVVTFDAPVILQSKAVYPDQLAQRTAQLDVPVTTIQAPQVRRFLNVTDAEYANAVASGGPSDPVNVFREVLAKTWTDHRVAVNLYQQQSPLLLMMNYEGADVVNHLFAPYHPPYREGISQTEYRKYWPAVANYYSEVDRLIGEWMKVLSDDTTVMIVSAHGFRWSSNTRPRTQPAGRSALSDHRNPGVFIAYGHRVTPSRASHSISIYDLVPTVLAVLGLPQSMEMSGKHAQWVFGDLTPVTTVRVVSYDEFFPPNPLAGAGSVDAQRYTRNLQTIGHLVDPKRTQPALDEEGQPQIAAATPVAPAQWGSYAYWNNQGVELRKGKKLAEAVEAFQKAIDLNPTRPTPYLNLAMTLFERQQYTAADDVFVMAVQRGLPNPEQRFADFAALYRSRDMTSRAIAILYKGKQLFPQSYVIAANLGSALAQADRYTEGLPELERALGLQPSSTLVLNNIGTYYAKKEDYARALDFWNRSLVIDPRQQQIRQAAEAARTHL